MANEGFGIGKSLRGAGKMRYKLEIEGENLKVVVFRLRPLGDIDIQGLPRSAESWIPEKNVAICAEIDPESRAAEFYQMAVS